MLTLILTPPLLWQDTTVDPFMCLAAVLSAAQTVVSRNLPPVEAGVISTTFVSGGSATRNGSASR